MLNLGRESYHVERGDRIAQLVICAYVKAEWIEEELGASNRGAGGFGSSGR
jgi:dUTP pyrophosphatase